MGGWKAAPDAGLPGGGRCTHGDADAHLPPREGVAACDDCPEGARWVNLLRCLTCGHTGCCDSSPGKHAYAHAETGGHPLARSLRSGDTWAWCYEDQLFVVPDDGGHDD
ncbi:UBP-type zinc finger domain-containing protein [Streptomyces sp. NPDC006288]|uniref:UBP-type zinc finger domain-containing protein n=1 Tax=Streptomyces sp. NPDC006288 TaxID=3156743 RepID=UPI0033B827C3